MNKLTQITRSFRITSLAIATLTCSVAALAGDLAPLIDDFSNDKNNNLGLPRQFMDDSTVGGSTSSVHKIENGTYAAKGEIVPPRGQPGWTSSVLPLDPQGKTVDASQFEGIYLRISVNKGNLSVTANSSEITNFDYHAAAISRKSGDGFQELKIPFSSMKRAWSEQTPLNPATLHSISLVAFGMEKVNYAFEVDEVRFY